MATAQSAAATHPEARARYPQHATLVVLTQFSGQLFIGVRYPPTMSILRPSPGQRQRLVEIAQGLTPDREEVRRVNSGNTDTIIYRQIAPGQWAENANRSMLDI